MRHWKSSACKLFDYYWRSDSDPPIEVCNVLVEQPDKFARSEVHDKPKSVITLYFKVRLVATIYA
jgi:hypothetical protein